MVREGRFKGVVWGKSGVWVCGTLLRMAAEANTTVAIKGLLDRCMDLDHV